MSNDPTISLAPNGNFALRFTHSDTQAHTIELPNSERGLDLIRYILTCRASSANKIGQHGNPTQAMIQMWLANKKEEDLLIKREADKAADDLILNDF